MAGASVAFGFARTGALADAADPQDAFEPTIWYSIDRDGIVTVNIIRVEMGQHVGTALAQILADELEADWNAVRIRAVDSDPKWGLMVAGGSWSVWMTFPVFSRAGAAGRIALTEAGRSFSASAWTNARRAMARSPPVVALTAGAKATGTAAVEATGTAAGMATDGQPDAGPAWRGIKAVG